MCGASSPPSHMRTEQEKAQQDNIGARPRGEDTRGESVILQAQINGSQRLPKTLPPWRFNSLSCERPRGEDTRGESVILQAQNDQAAGATARNSGRLPPKGSQRHPACRPGEELPYTEEECKGWENLQRQSRKQSDDARLWNKKAQPRAKGGQNLPEYDAAATDKPTADAASKKDVVPKKAGARPGEESVHNQAERGVCQVSYGESKGQSEKRQLAEACVCACLLQ